MMTKTWLRILSILEMVGGIVGIAFVMWWFSVMPFHLYSLVVAPIPIGIYILSFVAGLLLWKGNRFGRTTSIIVQAIQIPKIFSPYIIFMFSFGFDLWVQVMISNEGYLTYGIEFRFLAFNQLFLNAQNTPFGFGVSITALIFLILLLSHKPYKSSNNEGMLPPQPNEYLNPNN